MNAYADQNISAADAVGILVAAVREGKAAAETIAPAIGKVLPVASEAGVQFHEIAAGIAAMTRLGLNAQESVTALRGVLNAINKPSKEAVATLNQIGLPLERDRKSTRLNTSP